MSTLNKVTKYSTLRRSKSQLNICKNAREVIFTTISCMCDNVHTISFKKDRDGDFKMNGMGFALSNWQMKYEPFEIEWVSDSGDWDRVIEMINSGVEVIEKVVSR